MYERAEVAMFDLFVDLSFSFISLTHFSSEDIGNGSLNVSQVKLFIALTSDFLTFVDLVLVCEKSEF